MTRPRDSQRSKLYKAEAVIKGGPTFRTVDECQAFVDQIMNSRWVQARWHQRVIVKDGRGHQNATGSPHSGYIQLPLWARSKAVILHEMAHVLTPYDVAAHGPEYAGLYLTLVSNVLGSEAATKLRDSFREHRVRYNLKAVKAPRFEVPTQAAVAAKRRERDTRPLSAQERATVAALLRRAAKAGQLGAADRKPRIHALATARVIEAIA